MTKAGRNDPCPCGSGKKYKKCHGMGGSKKIIATILTKQDSHVTNRVSSLISGISSHSTSINSLKNRIASGEISSKKIEDLENEKSLQDDVMNAENQIEKKENFPL